MSRDDTVQTTDPERIRAVAHPVRLELLDLVHELGEATATQCAERLGETVANCSFHLRVLAKAGFIEPAPARGREKPWRLSSSEREMGIERGNPASRHAVAELVSLQVSRDAERLREFLTTQPDPPEGWNDTVMVNSSSFWATADELREVQEVLRHLVDRFAGRMKDPSLRPPGARHARFFAALHPDSFPGTSLPDISPEATADADARPGPEETS